MVLVATIGISALSLVLIDARKNSKMISSRFIADADIDRAVNYIGSLMMSPNNCSATFAGLPLAEPGRPKYLNETGIYKCPSDPSDPNAPCTRASRQVAINFDDWLIYPTETVTKAKLVEAKYELEKVYNSSDIGEKDNLYDQAKEYDPITGLIRYDWDPNPNPNLLIRPAYYKLTLKFVKNLGWSNGKMVTSNKEVSFHVPVVTKLYNEGVAIPNQETIIACPINPKSAVPYYNPFPDE
jgi:hypothetical protein